MSSMLDDRFRKPVGFRPEMPCRLSYSSMPGTTKNNGGFSYTHSGDNHRAFLTALMCLFQEVGHFPLQELVADVSCDRESKRIKDRGAPGCKGWVGMDGCLQQGSIPFSRLGAPPLSTSQERGHVSMIACGLEPFKA